MTQAAPSLDPAPGETRLRDRLLIAALAICTLALYFPSRNYGFVNYDDHLYVYENLHVLHGLSLDSIRWAMTAIIAANWHPLTLLLDCAIANFFGPNAGAFHLCSALLHALNVVLLFLFFRLATGRSVACWRFRA